MGKWAQRRLLELGATPVHELGLGNDDQDLQADFETWREGLWPALSAAIKGGTEGAAIKGGTVTGTEGAAEWAESAVAFEASFRCRWLPGTFDAPTFLPSSSFEWLCRAYPKQTLYECRVEASLELTNPELTNLELTTNLEGGSVRHIELACDCTERGGTASQLRYAAADDLGVCCDNGRPLAERTARALGLCLSASFEMLATARGAGMAPPLPSPCTLEHALRYYADVRAPAPKPLLRLLAAHTVDAAHARRLEHLASAAGKAEYTRRIVVEGRGLLELLEENPSCRPPLGAVLELVPKLSPRYYTISSSPIPSKGARVAITVKVLREPRKGAETRLKEGVCSTQLGALALGPRSARRRLRARLGLSTATRPGDASPHGRAGHGHRPLSRVCARAVRGAANGRDSSLFWMPLRRRRLPLRRRAPCCRVRGHPHQATHRLLARWADQGVRAAAAARRRRARIRAARARRARLPVRGHRHGAGRGRSFPCLQRSWARTASSRTRRRASTSSA